jgi:serine/threonine protein phosphatase PrpC
MEEALKDSFMEVDRKLDTEEAKDNINNMKKQYPQNKSKLMQLFSESLGNNNGGGGGGAGGMGGEGNGIDGIGCTANVIYMDRKKKKMYIANAGDSRSVLCRGGKAVALSYDHKPDGEEEKRRIEKAGSFV